MPYSSSYFPYRNARSFSPIAIDYTEGTDLLKPFYNHSADIEGIKKTIEERRIFNTDRKLLVEHLNEQYKTVVADTAIQNRINSLLEPNTFTITTAHQPNIFTGHLYFVYKILHAIKLAETLKQQMPENNFVPVYYMGSEDADLEELGEVYINGTHYRWNTNQTGSVGRMKIDKAFIELTDSIHAQLGVELYGNEIMQKVKAAYTLNKTIEQATFEFVHELFKNYGLIILLPDAAKLKYSFAPVIEKELKEGFSYKAVEQTMQQFPEKYKIQAAGREINLFYLEEGSRERIEKKGNIYHLANLGRNWNENAMLLEVQNDPAAFSPNVILRPVFQEWILPNVAFIGGGGELAYWLELKKVFEAAEVPYPVLVLRNSFLLVNKKAAEKIAAMQMHATDFFEPASSLLQKIVTKKTGNQLTLDNEIKQLKQLYAGIQSIAGRADATLQPHVEALYVGAEKRLLQLEKKMYAAEKKKFEAEQRQVEKIKSMLYPNGILQERMDNLLPWYAVYGKAFINDLYQHSLSLEQQFCVLQQS